MQLIGSRKHRLRVYMHATETGSHVGLTSLLECRVKQIVARRICSQPGNWQKRHTNKAEGQTCRQAKQIGRIQRQTGTKNWQATWLGRAN
jgi:hypothetical protein